MQALEVLKRDALGRVERLELGGRAVVRRVATGGRAPLSRWIACRLLARERRALEALAGLAGVPELVTGGAGRRDELVRTWVAGAPLSRAAALPEDFFQRLDELVLALHARGVCHNDLHKEPNVLVGDDGFPALVDFQLASVHPRDSALFRSRAREDLRHVEKHRRRYTRHGRGPRGVEQQGSGAGIRRSWLARAWRRAGKPAYVFVTRVLLRTRDGADPQRSSSGPWPVWTAPVGPRPRAG